MTMKQKLQIHREVERMDMEHRIWFHNNQIIDRLTDTFPPGSMVENFGVLAIVDGYKATDMSYTGDLILRDPVTGQRWIGNPEYCTAIA